MIEFTPRQFNFIDQKRNFPNDSFDYLYSLYSKQ